jgi:hypothetical protein
MSVFCECCVLSGRGLCDGSIARPEESYRVWGVPECDCESSIMRMCWPTGACCANGEKSWIHGVYFSLWRWSCIVETWESGIKLFVTNLFCVPCGFYKQF